VTGRAGSQAMLEAVERTGLFLTPLDEARGWWRLLDAGRSNQFISRHLTVTLDTTKKHVSHILAKLGAASRSEAVARARDLRLIP
jgi:ATP/maltotriose-dependent transcriptional regulator MalT